MKRSRKLLPAGLLLLVLWAFPLPSQTIDNTLEVTATPGTEVIWEGVSLGTIDRSGSMTIVGVPIGNFRIGLRREGYQDLSRRVEILEGANALRVELEQRPSPPPITAQDERPEANEVPASAQEPARSAPEGEESPETEAAREPRLEARESPLVEPATAAKPMRDPGRAAGSWWWGALAASALALATLLWRRRLARTVSSGVDEIGARPMERSRATVLEEDTGGAIDPNSSDFLAELRRRERDIEEEEVGGVVIDAEVLEVWEDGDG